MVRDTDKIHKYLELKPAGGLGYGARSETGLVRFTLRCLLIASTKFSVLRGGLHLAGINFSYSAGWVPFRDTCIQQIIRIHTC